MKIFSQSTDIKKVKNNWSLISFLTLCSYTASLLTLVALANVDTVVLFQPPPKEEQPESTEGAASRQNIECPQDFLFSQQESLEAHNIANSADRPNLTAVVPDDNYGLTVVDRPDLWVYLPKTSAKQAILSIKEEGVKPHWQQSINLTGETGITGIKLSDNAPSLEIGKNYRWAVILVCGNKPNPNDPVVAAWIKRVDRSNRSSPIASTELEKAAWYAQNGIWYDALSTLIEAKKPSLDNWNDIWVKYLQSGGLDEITNEPVVGAIRP